MAVHVKTCECGCGAAVKRRFLRGHHSKLRRRNYLPEKHREQIRAWALANPERVKYAGQKHHYKKNYGLTPEEAHEMKANGCAICGADGTCDRGIIVIDHDHATGQVRGTLCEKCNRGIGHLLDDTSTLLSAVSYLWAHKGLENACT